MSHFNIRYFLSSISLLLIAFWSCSKPKEILPKVSLKVSELQRFEIGRLGMSGVIPFIFMPDQENKNNLLVYNEYFRRIDSVFFYPDTVLIQEGLEVPFEGPNGVSDFISYFPFNGYMTYVSSYGIGIDSEKGFDFVGLGSFEFIENDNMTQIVRSIGFNQTFTGFRGGNEIYFITKNFIDEKFAVNQFDLSSRELKIMNFPLKEELLKVQDAVFQYKNSEIRAFNFPFILATENELVVSYPFTNTIQVLNLETEDFEEDSPFAQRFPQIKKAPISIPSNSSREQGKDMINIWSNDVSFGPILPYQEKYFYRIVRGPTSGSSRDFFIEVFDLNFKKVLEQEILELKDVPKITYFSTGDDIILNPIKYLEDDEDYFTFYRANILEVNSN